MLHASKPIVQPPERVEAGDLPALPQTDVSRLIEDGLELRNVQDVFEHQVALFRVLAHRFIQPHCASPIFAILHNN